jgi:hypothetical protein
LSSARQYLRVSFHKYVPGEPIVWNGPAIYNPSRQVIDLEDANGLAGDCRFKTRDLVECKFILQESRLTCVKFTAWRKSNDELSQFIADNWQKGNGKIKNSFLEKIQSGLGGLKDKWYS